MKKLAIITSHPIQYNAPLFRLLHSREMIMVKVFYTWGQTQDGHVYDPDFKRSFTWDIPLLDGYDKEFVENISDNPGAGSFNGIKNKDLSKHINAYKPDAILLYGWSFQSHLQVLRAFSGKLSVLFRGDSTLLDEPEGFSLKTAIRRIFLRWVYSHVNAALYTGIANKAYYLKHGLKNDQLQLAPHAIENKRFEDHDGQLEQKARLWRKQLGICDDDLVFLFAGKFEPKKDPMLLVKAFQSLAGSNSKLLLVGDGVLKKELQEQAGDNPNILFLDFQNQQLMPVVYRVGDVFILPSKGPGETWGLSVNEAMASGRPVIVSNKCGCAEDLVNENGFVFSAGNLEQLRGYMQQYIISPELVKRHSKRSQLNIQSFSIEKIAVAIEQLV